VSVFARLEATTGKLGCHSASLRRQQLLDVREFEAKDKDHKYSVTSSPQGRREVAGSYSERVSCPVPTDEGGRSLGGSAVWLMRIPRQKWEERKARVEGSAQGAPLAFPQEGQWSVSRRVSLRERLRDQQWDRRLLLKAILVSE